MESLLRNRQLFSEVYLRELQTAKGAVERLAASRQTIREWRQESPSLADLTTLRMYVEGCLSALMVAYSPREQGDGWTLFSDASKHQPAGLCLTVQDEDLGLTAKGRHHQARLVRVLREAGLHWGILTNGQHWRLCHASGPAPYEQSLEADLDALLAEPDLAGFRVFHRFFGASAFLVKPYDPPPPPLARNVRLRIGLDGFLEESERRTAAIERHLNTRVEPILHRLCLGFVADVSADHYTREMLDEIYRNAIYLLYRILFLFYAEARDLLPVDDLRYRPHSLAAIVEEVRKRQQEGAQDQDPYSLWKRLDHLFVVVDLGDDTLGVAAYNGGLFSRMEKKYLSDHRLTDDYLVPPLYELALESTKTGRHPIDYRDLSVRHLGTLYEGMLEYRLNRVSGEPRVVRETGGKRRYVPLSAAQPVKKGETILEVGDVFFADDRGERKSSGSYYTPEDVVQYIVKNTVGPKLEERRDALVSILEEAERAREFAATDEECRRIERYADSKALEIVEQEVLGLRILDPAMGSGHFLVAAGQLVTDFCVETLNLTNWANDDLSTDPLLWKRRAVERCLYGVDKNPLALELAKLALWITSASKGKPLTFLDHHLKLGNSLYGTPLARMATLPTAKQSKDDGLLRLARESVVREALERLAEIAGRDSDDIAAVREKAIAYRAALETTQCLRDVANVWLASLFDLKGDAGNPISEAEYVEILEDLTRNYAPSHWEVRVSGSRALREARDVAEQEKFFHWELEFPDTAQGAGSCFDIVVANPPYVGTRPNAAVTTLFSTARSGDLYAWIIERALQLTQRRGNVGTIVPLSLMFSRQFTALRALLLKRRGVVRCTNFDSSRDGIFPPSTGTRNGQRATILTTIDGTGDQLIVETSRLVRWIGWERPYLLTSLTHTSITSISSAENFPKIGDRDLVDFWERLRKSPRTVRGLCTSILSEGQKDYDSEFFLIVPRAVRYFLSAFPVHIDRDKVLTLTFDNRQDRNLVGLLLNSNVHYWYWLAFGDGFVTNVDQVARFPVPELPEREVQALAEELFSSTATCMTHLIKCGKAIPNVNYNRRMDILLQADKLIIDKVGLQQVLRPDVFLQYKSNSMLRPADLASLVGAEEVDADE